MNEVIIAHESILLFQNKMKETTAKEQFKLTILLEEGICDYAQSNHSAEAVREAFLATQKDMSSQAGYRFLTKVALIDSSLKSEGSIQADDHIGADESETAIVVKRGLGSSRRTPSAKRKETWDSQNEKRAKSPNKRKTTVTQAYSGGKSTAAME